MSRSKQPPFPTQPAPTTVSAIANQLIQATQSKSSAKKRKRTSSSTPTSAASPSDHHPSPSSQPGDESSVPTVQPPPSLKASRPLPTEAPPPKQRLRVAPVNPESWAAKDIVQRMFGRFAESRGGIMIDGTKFYTFLEAADPSVSGWTPQLFAEFVTFYAANARPRRPGNARVDAKALFIFQQSVRRTYSRGHKRALSKKATVAATAARHISEKLTDRRVPRPTLTMAEVLSLARAVWSPEYPATFRRRLDVALYMALVLPTGVPSMAIFPAAIPGKGYDEGPVYALPDKTDGARWSDIEIWMTRYGPAAQFTCRADGERRYTLNDGNSLGMAASRLMAISMCFDELYGSGCHLGYLLSNVFWSVDGHDARIVAFDQELTDKHIFRLDDDAGTPMMREDMNFELARLADAAGIEHEVTTGMFRRFVAHNVFEQHGLEIASAILNHNELVKTQRYLEKKLGRTVTPAERELGRGMDTLHKDLWLTLDHQLRVKTIQKIPDYITPHAWVPDLVRSPSPPMRDIAETDLNQRTNSLAQRPGSPETPTPFTGQPRNCLVGTPTNMRSGPTSPTDSFSNHMSPAHGSAGTSVSSQPKVAVHHHQLFGQTSATRGQYSQQTFVGGQTGVSAHVAMYGQFPKISDIRGIAPGAPAMPVVAQAQASFSPPASFRYQPEHFADSYRPQNTVRPQSQQSQAMPAFPRMTQQPTSAKYGPNDHGLPTPDETPPDSFQMLPGLSSIMPPFDFSNVSGSQGLGLIFESTGGAAMPQSRQRVAAPRAHARQPSNTLPELRELRSRLPPHPTPRRNMTYQERVLDAVSRWMAGPAQSLQNGVDLVYTMIECDKHLPRNETYDPNAFDEEDVDTDEE